MLLRFVAVCLILNLVNSSILSCRVINGLCQGDDYCLEEMKTRFPHCYFEALKRSVTPPINQKRASSFKLLNILMKVDRIPVG
ncbi:unnamed protein product [Bursaphelenchus xylophilus]|uniref:(pine wood nematode) hypothetical protein n=1 Tax=Bursaphelenchus xylophilus TaxID=6326 RepID=A0A1I7RS19_BURXY|nr:unnamed protein product [Bursaphelenchus xylophilus]CAG9123315.1 unnamed protein product [Bursaphelenchus xylophilus]